MTRTYPGDMTTDEAVDYLGERLQRPITKTAFAIVRTWHGTPVPEIGQHRLWFRRQDLDAFLTEFPSDHESWLVTETL